MEVLRSKPQLEKSGYYFVGLLFLAILGFWPTYFGQLFSEGSGFNFYFHFHSTSAGLWILSLIVQPILIRRKKLAAHRLVGRSSYVLMPLIFISVALLAHHRINPETNNLGIDLWIPFKDLLVLGAMYGIAIRNRRNIAIHARGMIVVGWY